LIGPSDLLPADQVGAGDLARGGAHRAPPVRAVRRSRPGRELPQRHPHQDGVHAGSGRCRSRCRGTGMARSSRRSQTKRQRRLSGVDQIVSSLSAKVSPLGRSRRTSPTSTAPPCSRTPFPHHRQGAGGDGQLASSPREHDGSCALETGGERIRSHLRRPDRSDHYQLMTRSLHRRSDTPERLTESRGGS